MDATMDATAWDGALRELGGSLLQSWRWGEFSRGHGWEVERLRVDGPRGIALAQVQFKRVGPVSLAYVLHGPALGGEAPAVFGQLVAALDDACRRRRALSLVLEPDRPLPLTGTYKGVGFVRGPEHFETSHMVKVPLGSDDVLLAQMRKGTRYDVRRAPRRGVTVERPGDDAGRLAFYRILQETSRRHGFPIRPRAYYDDVLRVFQDDAALLLARVDGATAAGVLVLRFGDEAVYLSGASATEHRGQDAGSYLQYEAMRWARERGCTRYNMWGVATESLRHFKVGLGGEVVASPPTLARRYRPVLAALAPRAMNARRRGRDWLARRSGARAE